ncbi:MAG: hypothetical protein N3A72_11235 [bacterium]|nr:hypothetical protein [bacterium]
MSAQERGWLTGLFIIVMLTVFSISFYAIRTSTDEWWHLRTGEYIVEHRALPQNDIFAYTSLDLPWVNHEWLAQVIFFLVYDTIGIKGFIFFKSIIIVATFAILFFVVRNRAKNPYIALLVTLIAALASRHTLYPRPPIFSYLLMASYLFLLYSITDKPDKKIAIRYLALFPILMIFWVNLHGGAILGIILVGSFLVGNLIAKLNSKILRQPLPTEQTKILAIILLLVLLASLINPYGYKVFKLTIDVMKDKTLVESIGELKSPDFHYTHFYELLILLLIISFAWSLTAVTPTDLILVIFFLHQSLNHVRHLPLFGIIAAPIVGKHFALTWQNLWTMSKGTLSDAKNRNEGTASLSVEEPSDIMAELAPASKPHKFEWNKIIASVLIILVFSYVLFIEGQIKLNFETIQGPGFRIRDYPVYAADFILANDFTGNMFNEINSSGYLMWRLYPKHLVFTDNRFDIFGSKFLKDFYTVTEVWDGWQQVLEKYNINYFIISKDSLLDRTLAKTAGWVKVYYDDGYVIYVKDIPSNAELITRCQNTFRFWQHKS